MLLSRFLRIWQPFRSAVPLVKEGGNSRTSIRQVRAREYSIPLDEQEGGLLPIRFKGLRLAPPIHYNKQWA